MNDPKAELARAVFVALHRAGAAGLDRSALAQAIQASDREMREAVELCAKLAAAPTVEAALPEVVGFDPMLGRYVIANSPEQADRILTYALSYIKSSLERVSAYEQARKARWGETPMPDAVQQALFDARELVDRGRYRR